MPDKIRWGIIGAGNISAKFAEGLQFVEDAELVAIGSRSQESADTFGNRFNIPHRHATYEALVADPDVDVVYIGTPHPAHKANALLCLEHGKAVLCEKPFAMNAAEAAEVVDFARKQGLFMMEAMWTRHLPLFVKLRQMLDEQILGEIRLVQADFAFYTPFNPKGRLFAPELGGGALLDAGIYPVSLASFIYGKQPQQVASFAHKAPTGVDDRTTMLFEYEGGATAQLFCATQLQTLNEAVIAGEKGIIRLHSRWLSGTALTLTLPGQEAQFISAPILNNNGYSYEAAEVARCMRAGLLESPVMPLDETIAIMQTMDRVQQQW